MSRVVTLVIAVGFAVVGIAGAARAHHNTITGTVACTDGGGWAVTWRVVNSETDISETIVYSNRAVVQIGTMLTPAQARTFTETVTTKPVSPLTLTLKGKWVRNGSAIYSTNSGSIAVASFSDSCNVTKVAPPTVPVVDECGPGNARFGTVPSGPWTSVLNPDGSLTITANRGYKFTDGQTSVTSPKPTDSNTPCPAVVPTVPVVDDCGPGNAHYGTVPAGQWTSVVNPNGSLTITANPGLSFPHGQQSVTLPVPTDSNQACAVVAPPEVLPAQLLIVRAGAKRLDKCGRASDLYKVSRTSGVVYKVNGKVVRQGVWIKAPTRSVTVRAFAADANHQLVGRSVWKLTFTRKVCAQAPEIAPNTGS